VADSGIAHAGISYSVDSFFGRLADADRAALFALGHRRAYHVGHHLCREADPPGAVLVIVAGFVKLTKTARSGREAMLEVRGPGDVLGEMSAIDGLHQSANAVATGDVEVLVVASADFNALLDERASVARSLLGVAVGRLRQASSRQAELGTVEAMGRVCRRLVEQAEWNGEPTADGALMLVRRPLSQQDLAAWAGVSRDSVVRILRELRDLGILDSGRRRVLIHNMSALRQRAGLEVRESA
jgi:CRP/FNR family cyclic AMP-dependent transcriptional regulator